MTFAEGRLTIAGATIAYLEAGSGPLLLLGHGTFGGKELFTPQLESLASTYHCVAIDWPGHGQSTYAAEGWGVDELVELVPDVIESLGHTSAYLAGVSQGGAVFLRAALKSPERVDALIDMCAGPGAPPPAALARMQAFGAILRDEQDEGLRRDATAAFTNAMFHAPGFAERNPEAAAREVEVILHHPREAMVLVTGVPASYRSIIGQLSEITCPVLVLWGAEDLRPQVGQELADAIDGSELIVLDGAGHHVNVDSPTETSAAIEHFLAGL